eukprot:Tamp_13926.p1 GENE.Tamp_13926~~Tamp_13926.p1  ORF type:complete len:488 (+),score=104.37 Tamp_13926:92-1465(+)
MTVEFHETLPHWVGGRKVFAPAGARLMPKLDPATGELLCRVPVADETTVDAAVGAAREAFGEWSAMSGAERGRILAKAASFLYEAHPELARLEVLDTGKPLAESEADVSGADAMHFYAGHASTTCVSGSHIPLGGAGFGYTRREPWGVCAGIGAWNYPNQIALWKGSPALACGNAFVFKPSELTPMSAVRIAEVLSDAGVPDGLFNVVHGDHTTGTLLTTHTGVRKVSLTGSVSTGKKIMAAAASSLKAVTLELGGKSPMIVFPDADLDNAVRGALMANFYTMGEVCSNGTRLLVHRDIKEQFVRALADKTSRITPGDPMEAATNFGALISSEHRDKVRAHIARAKAEGCHAVVDLSDALPQGGGRDLSGGFFLGPTVFDQCPPSASILHEEVFGPVVCVQGFETEEEALRLANDTPFGLAAAVFTSDINRAHRVAAALDAGTTWINEYNLGAHSQK